MSNQSGKMVLGLILLLVVFVASVYFFRRELFIKSINNTFVNKASAVPRGVDSSQTKSYQIYQWLTPKLEFEYPLDSRVERFEDYNSFGEIKGIKPLEALKLYYNVNTGLTPDQRMYSGLTMFFIVYPNKNKLSLDKFVPSIKPYGQNIVNKQEVVKLGFFEGVKYTSCCIGGGGVEYYFLGKNDENLIQVKVYNRGGDNEIYAKVEGDILNSLNVID